MAQIDGQQWHHSINIHTLLIPEKQTSTDKGMPKVIEPGVSATGTYIPTKLSPDALESVKRLSILKRTSVIKQKKSGILDNGQLLISKRCIP
jgi:hypothetical protein